jgi:hypothetical protein
MTHPLNFIVRGLFAKVEPVGSRVTCVPAPTDTDEDWLCLLSADTESGVNFDAALVALGWRLGGSQPTDDQVMPPSAKFWSYTHGEVNIIVTQSTEFFARFMAATAVSKRLNLLNKADRIALFQAVLYANY